IVSVTGSSNSHMAIVARALGIPTVVGASHAHLGKLEGKNLIVDGYQGQVILNAPEPIRQHYSEILLEEQQLVQGFEACRDLPCEMTDGHSVSLWVNTGLMADVVRSQGRGAEGVGLYRTEIPFMARDRFPSEDEQQAIYRKQLEAFSPLPVTMRTLDIGGDKSLPYFPISEENPFLGWRGIRISLDHPEIFLAQIRAMLKASAGLNNLRILLPMISSILEIEEACYLIHRAWMELQDEGYTVLMPQIGAMIEVPGAVYQAREIASMVDFVSVGSNDLTQYMLAVDRNNPRVAGLYQSFHPAVIRALTDIVKACHEVGKTVSVCGEMAGDPAGAALLSAMGYDSLSMSASSLLKVKWALRQLNYAQTKEWLEHVLTLDNAAMVQSYMGMKLDEEGLGGLIRAGK
ncbi:MAG: phosphoenolpyruvate--protein phosphotransferase, partial [Pseudomonadales bacterium]|nr:phosphoenolpyruvate--protein phosphotransferase [Pseudomonadales bacterium]